MQVIVDSDNIRLDELNSQDVDADILEVPLNIFLKSGDDLICMDDVKKLKPDAEAYIKIVEKNKWNKDDVVVIGDSSADISGGKN